MRFSSPYTRMSVSVNSSYGTGSRPCSVRSATYES